MDYDLPCCLPVVILLHKVRNGFNCRCFCLLSRLGAKRNVLEAARSSRMSDNPFAPGTGIQPGTGKSRKFQRKNVMTARDTGSAITDDIALMIYSQGLELCPKLLWTPEGLIWFAG